MNETRSRYWVSILLYTMISTVFLGLIYVIVETFFPKTSSELIPRMDSLSARFMSTPRWDGNYRNAQKRTPSNPLKEKIMILLDRDINIGKSKIFYRGIDENSKFIMDVVILELDPNAFYRYRIPIADAKKGFRLAGQNFRLISARKSAVHLRRLTTQ